MNEATAGGTRVRMIPATMRRYATTRPLTERLRVAAYARVSTDDEEQLTSYEAQVDYYTKKIRENPDWTFVEVYADEGISGTNTKKRKNFNRMIYDAMAGKYMNRCTAATLLVPAAILLALAVLPGQLFSPLGALCAPFFGQEAISGEIAYFSGENLLGAAKSLAIGLVVYFLVVRLWLMAKNEKGARVYVNRWPRKLDLEDAVYRPVLLKLLPGLCTLVVRFVAELPETVVLFLRDTIFSKRKKAHAVPVGNRFTYACGKLVNGVAIALNATFLRNHPMRTDFEYVFDASWKEFITGTHIIIRSVSFGLLLLCIGLYFTCAYLMMH